MYTQSRRSFLRHAAAAATLGTYTLYTGRALANPLGIPLGLQLYSVRELLAKEYEATLKQVAALGYQQVEAAGFYGHSPAQVRAALASAGLRMPSAHYSATDLHKSFDETLRFAQELGLQYLICSFPAIKDPSRLTDRTFRGTVESFTLDDYRWLQQAS